MSKTISYWNGNGKYQKEFDVFCDTFVPARGRAKTNEGNIIRALQYLWYEYCNNGNINIVGKDVWDGFKVLVNRGEESCYDIKYNVPNISGELSSVCDLILRKLSEYNYNQDEFDVYNELTDKCVEYILKTSGE